MAVITSSNTGFKKMLDLQRLSVEHLETIRDSLLKGLSNAELVEKIDELRKSLETNSSESKLDEKIKSETSNKQLDDINDKLKESLEEEVKTREQTLEAMKQQLEVISQVASSMKTFKTLGDSFKDLKTSLKERYGSINRSVISSGIIKEGGTMDRLLGFSKRIEREKFVKKQRELGSTESTETLKQSFAKAQKSAKLIQATDADIEDFKKTTGLSEKEMVKTKKGRDLLEKKATATKEYAKYDLAASIKAKDTIDEARKKGEKNTAPENDVEAIVAKTIDSLTDDQIKHIVESIILAIPENKTEEVLTKAMSVFPEERQKEIGEKTKDLDPNEPEKIKEFILQLVQTSTQEQLNGIRDIITDAVPESMIKAILRQTEVTEKLVEKSDVKVNLDTAKESINSDRISATDKEDKAEQDRKDELLLEILELIEKNTRKEKAEKKVTPVVEGSWGSLGKIGLGIAAVLGGIYGALVGQLKAIQFFAKALLPTKWIASITSTFDDVVKYASKIKGTVAQTFDFFKFVFAGDPTKGLGKVFAIVENVFSKITGFFTKVFPTIGKYFDDFARMFGVASKIVGKIAYPLTVILTLWDTLKGAFEGWEEGGLVGAVSGAIKGFFNSLVFGLADLVKSALSWVLGAIGFDSAEKFLDSFSFQDIFNNFVDALFKPFAGLQDMIVGLFTFDLGRIQEGIMKIAESLIDGLMFPINMVKSFISGLFDLVGLDKLSELLDSFDPAQFFKDFVNMLIHPIDTLKKMFDGVVNFFRDIHIPEIGFTIPFIGKKISIGPFYPFRKDEKEGVRSEGDDQPKKKEIKPEGEAKGGVEKISKGPSEKGTLNINSTEIRYSAKDGKYSVDGKEVDEKTYSEFKKASKEFMDPTQSDEYKKRYKGEVDKQIEEKKKSPFGYRPEIDRPFAESAADQKLKEDLRKPLLNKLVKSVEAVEQYKGSSTPTKDIARVAQPIIEFSTEAPTKKSAETSTENKNWKERLKSYEEMTPVDMYEKAYPGITETFKALAKKYPPKSDSLQSLDFHERKLTAVLIKGFQDGTITPVEKKAEGVKPVQEPSAKAEQLKPEEKSTDFEKQFKRENASRAFRGKIPLTEDQFKMKLRKEEATKKLGLFDKIKVAFGADPEELAKKSISTKREEAKDTSVGIVAKNEAVKISPTGISTREAPLQSRARELQAVAKERGIEGKVTGVYEGSQLTKIRTEDGREIDVSDRLTPEQKKSVEAARTLRQMNQRSEQLEMASREQYGDRIARDSQKVDVLRQETAKSSAPIVVAPAIANNTTNNAHVTKMEAPLRPQDSTIDRYFNARAVF